MGNRDEENALPVRAGEVGMKAIPTLYNGCRFRSRLEAKWAAFFDHCLWQWEYEPCDLEGWAPDFLIKTGSRSVWVEVKPLAFVGEPQRDGDLIDSPSLNKVRTVIRGMPVPGDEEWHARKGDEVIVLGLGPFHHHDFGPAIGYFMLEAYDCGLDPVRLKQPHDTLRPDVFDFCAGYGSWQNRIRGTDHRLPATDWFWTQQMWRWAGQKVQWRPEQ